LEFSSAHIAVVSLTLVRGKRPIATIRFNNLFFKQGMTYLHASSIVSHGNLTAYTCRIDSNFVLKIIDHGLHIFRNTENLQAAGEYDEDRDFELLLWRAPELLRRKMPPEGTQVIL
jgi:hypothetical protein